MDAGLRRHPRGEAMGSAAGKLLRLGAGGPGPPGRRRSSGSGSAPAGRPAGRPPRPRSGCPRPAPPRARRGRGASGAGRRRSGTARRPAGAGPRGRSGGSRRGSGGSPPLTVACKSTRRGERDRSKPTPAADGYRMPGEFEPHAGCWMAWPERPDNWRLGAKPAQEAFAAVAAAIAASEPVTMAVSAAQFERAGAALPPDGPGGRGLDRRRLDARHRPDLRRRRRRRAARRRLALQRLGRHRGRPLLPLGPRRPGRREGAGDRGRRPLPGAARARGRRDPRRRRGHGADHRRVPAQPQPQPGALREQIERVLLDYLGAEKVVWLGAGRLRRRDRRPRRQPRLLRPARGRCC